uniref:SET domain-containing protein 4 n=1 Tax=Anthurium amnicola TaxID=1678845 RepID=A0A1D1XE40_9ARAE
MAEVSRTFRSSLLPHFPRNQPARPRQCGAPRVAPRRSLTTTRCSISTASGSTSGVSERGAVPWGCEIESLGNAEELQRWLSESGLPPQKMGIERVEVGERGLVALKNIRKGEKLLFVPPSLVITADTAWSSPGAGDVLKKYSVPDWPYLATYLISEASLMESSRWSRYIAALPRQPYSLLYCIYMSLQDTFRT